MSKDKVLSEIRNVANTSIPHGARVILFGSRARGDAHANSDWDILILVDKDHLQAEDHDQYSYPFWELGWKIDAMIHPMIYTVKDWETKSSPLFRENVELECMKLC